MASWSTARRSCAARTTRTRRRSSSARPLRGVVIAQEGGGYALRVWDAQSEAIENFGGIDAFPYDPAWVITARVEENPEGTTMGFEHLKDDGHTREEVIPGSIRFTHDGVDYDLAAFKAGRALQLVFADATNGDSTYSVGRFLYVAPNADGTITLDFNRAVLPPCAFSYAFNCPLPPKQNRFAFAVEAGEKNVLAADGSLLHLGLRMPPTSPCTARPKTTGLRSATSASARSPTPRSRSSRPPSRCSPSTRRDGGSEPAATGMRRRATRQAIDAGRRDRAGRPLDRQHGVLHLARAPPDMSQTREPPGRRANLVGVFVDPDWRGDAGVTDACRRGRILGRRGEGTRTSLPSRQPPQPPGDPLVSEARLAGDRGGHAVPGRPRRP